MMRRYAFVALTLALVVGFWSLLPTAPAAAASASAQGETETLAVGANPPLTYTNPLLPVIPTGGVVESCADPSVMRSQTPGDNYWYAYCTTDPLNDEDQTGGQYNFHLVPMLRSLDLVNWTYLGDAFTTRPSWAAPTAGVWAPEIQYFNGQYYLYYGITDVTDAISGVPGCDSDNAIGVATATSPTGPWTDVGAPVILPRQNGGGCNFFWTYDPEVVTTSGGQRYIYYGSYYGGIEVRELSANGQSTTGAAVPVAIGNRYEGSEVVFHDGFYYLFVSATNCCAGPLTAYSVFVGRSASPTGPFLDRTGASFLAGRVGGTPVLTNNGNRWVGPGHNSVFTDFDGQMWTIYHAIDENDPYFAGAVGFTKRPLMMDPVDWVNGWPTVRGGFFASDMPMPAPAAQPGQTTDYNPTIRTDPIVGSPVITLTDEFSGTLGPQWTWVRQPAAGTYGINAEGFFFNTQDADLYVDNNSASVLTEPTPTGNYLVEARVRMNLPPEGCCHNYRQGGLVIYGDDNNFIKLTHVSIWETRQIEFAKEVFPVPTGFPRYGNTVVGPADEWTYLRIVKQDVASGEHYTAYTSRDGSTWERGGTWRHALGSGARIGLVSMGGPDFVTTFDYVRVYRLVAPTAVQLGAFDAAPEEAAIRVRWETVVEEDTLGFNLLRAPTAGGEATRLNPALIPAEGASGSQYEWTDRDVAAGTTYFYWLESVSTGGQVERFGPVSATTQSSSAVTLAALGSHPAPGGVPMGAVALALLALAAGGVALKRRVSL